jgi:two-component system sensor histidine kinase VanS
MPGQPMTSRSSNGTRLTRTGAAPARLPGSIVIHTHGTVPWTSGEDLSPDVVATLTEPFRRGTGRLHADHTGVGLGLAIVASIVRAHDGELTLAPRAAGGLCVAVQLPAARPAP